MASSTNVLLGTFNSARTHTGTDTLDNGGAQSLNFTIHHVHQEGITLSSGSCCVINPPKAPDLSRLNQTHLCLNLEKKDAINQIHGGN